VALDYVHAVDAKGADADEGLAGAGRRLWRFGIDEEGISSALAAFDV
jgi:hypothetical protein